MILADQCVSTGKLRPEAAKSLVATLSEDMAEYPEQWVIKALSEHRKASPFFPVTADLWRFIEPLYEARERRRAFEAQSLKARDFMALPAPPRPPEDQRKQTVQTVLGYNPADARAVRQARQNEEGIDVFKKAGLTDKQARSMSGSELLTKTIDKSKPHWKPGSKEHSHRTPDEIVAALGQEPLSK